MESSLLVDFENCLNNSTTSISGFLQDCDNVSEDTVFDLVGVFAEHCFKNGVRDVNRVVRTEFPTLCPQKVESVLMQSFQNFISWNCPVTNALGQLPAEIDDLYIEKELGRGGTSVVYLARQQSLNRLVAVKVPFFPSDTFSNEALTLSRMNHPGICGIFFLGTLGKVEYLVLQFVNGVSLDSFRGKTLSQIRAVKITIKVLEAIDACHCQGIYHADLKPGNILLEQNQPVIVDFGLAHSSGTRPALNDVGSPGYMAPELLQETSIKSPTLCDLFSVGVILYELLTGSKPYTEKTANPLPPRRCTDFCDIDSELEKICLKAVSVRPEMRFQTASVFQQTLTEWLENRSKSDTNGRARSINKGNSGFLQFLR